MSLLRDAGFITWQDNEEMGDVVEIFYLTSKEEVPLYKVIINKETDEIFVTDAMDSHWGINFSHPEHTFAHCVDNCVVSPLQFNTEWEAKILAKITLHI